MGYTGQVAEIRFGQYGLMYDMAQQDLPQNSLIRAENVQYYNGIVEKAHEIIDWVIGNSAYSTPQFTGEKPLATHRYYPVPRVERQIVLTDQGNVYKYETPLKRYLVTAQSPTDPTTLSINTMPIIISGGNEVQGNEKKVFIFSGNSQIQVLTSDGLTRRNITTPSADWDGSTSAKSTYPTFGLIYRGSMIAFGNQSSPHTIYVSKPGNEENFDSTDPTVSIISCFPGEGDGLISAFIYKGRVFFFKKPYGVYCLIDTDPSPTNWYCQKISSSIGIASPLSFIEVANDNYVMSNDGSIFSMSAAFTLGDIYTSDILSQMQVSTPFREIIRKQFLFNSFAKYLPQRKVAYFAFPSFTSPDGTCDSFAHIDFNGTYPRVSWHRYNSSTFTCADYYKDPYGDDHLLFGKLYYSNKVYNYGVMATQFPVNTIDTPFRVRTPNSTLGVPANKEFDAFEIMFEGTNAYPLAVDVFIDSKFSQTFLIQPYFKGVMGPPFMTPTTDKYSEPYFQLDNVDTGSLNSRGARPKYNSLKGRGQTISFLIRDGNVLSSPYTGNPNPDDNTGTTTTYKIVGIRVYYRVAGQDQKDQTK